jgi:hypothetical protein
VASPKSTKPADGCTSNRFRKYASFGGSRNFFATKIAAIDQAVRLDYSFVHLGFVALRVLFQIERA